jgi:hypothetical protein
MQEIKDWKKQNIAYAEFQFSCGGDSMNDTDLLFYNEQGDVVNETCGLSAYFENEVYNEVSFYEASDGHYMGENGVVRIELSDEEDEFHYMKSAQSEWCERYNGELECEVTEDEVKFLTEYIGGMSDASWNGRQTDYKKDFVLTDEYEEMIDDLHTKFQDCADEFAPETKGERTDDSTTYNTAEDEGAVGLTITQKEGKHFVKLYVECEVYEYTDSDD